MSVVIETTLGDITVDLYLDQRPVTCLNFLKLCKMKYYNFNLFHTIRNGFIAQTGDPSGEGSGGKSIWGILEGPHKRFFSGEKMPKIRHTDAGLLSMVCTDDMMVGSQFFFTLAPDLNSLDGTHCVIGEVTEGHDVLTKLNEVICDESHRPYRDVRITHTVVLEDPFNDPTGIRAPSRSPSPSAERLKGGRIAPDEEIDEAQGKSAEEIQEMIEEKEAKARATILEIVGDLPDAEIAPPENVLFVCKLNPVTTDEDLEIIFSRFGKIVSCEVIRDKKTGNSLQYAFIEFDNKKSCEDAYFKMDNVLIDDRRIHVDFSQSVSKMRWLGKGRGVQYFDDDSKKMPQRDEGRVRHKDQRPEYTDNRRHHENERNGEERHREREDSRHRQDRDRESYRGHKERERARDLDHKTRKRERSRDHRERSRSRSKNYDKKHESRRDRIRDKSSKDNNKHRDDTEVRKYDNSRNNHQNNLRSTSSPCRNYRNEWQESSSRTNRDVSETKNGSRSHKKHHENNSQHSRHDEAKYNKSDKESKREKHKQKRDKQIESKTPSPIIKEKKPSSKIDKNSKQKHRDVSIKKKERKARKRKHSSSSSLSSSESSSSTDSSSSGSDRKKRKAGRKKRKHSTSSSSSETSSSSSSSSDSSSESSSSTDSSQEKRNHKKKIGKKNKKKL